VPLRFPGDEEFSMMPDEPSDEAKIVRFANDMFRRIEHVVYIAIGVLLSAGAFLALGSATVVLIRGLQDWTQTDAILLIIDRLLFVLLLIEILHTIRASIRTGELTCEPFLVVGLIASIRRVLVITLQTSEATKPGAVTEATAAMVHESMFELAVLGGLILILVASLFLLGKSGRTSG
jgi:uncharacterized membrane protein (DUF373 family)